MTKVTVRHEEYEFSHGKKAKGKGCWAFTANRGDDIDDTFFASYGTVLQGAKEAAKYFGVTQVWAQP